MLNLSNQQVAKLINILMMLLIVFLWLKFALNNNITPELSSSKISSSIKESVKPVNQVPIAQFHIFGSSQQQYEVALSQGQTSLDFVLNGTMSQNNEKTGMAYISNSQGLQKVFKVGDKVFNVATLKEIYKTYVVVNHNGKNERLSLPEKPQTTNKSRLNVSKTKKNTKKNQPAYLKHLNGNQQRDWQKLMEQQKFDPQKISKIASNINLVTDQAGQIQGLRVSNLASGNKLSKLGLKSNDIITAVNGNRVSGQNMLTIKQTLEQNPNATVTIKRNGKIQNIQLNLGDL